MGGGGGGGHDPFDIFQSFFGGSPFGGKIVFMFSEFSISLCNFHFVLSFGNIPVLSGGGSSRGRRQRRGEDVIHPLKVSLEDLCNGTSKKLSLSRNVICSKCKG